ncbi:hypothetical protein [Mycobacterium lentiflavum]|uniref:hypothetical protein n=1 Tax=Mycobacterium lentiflavum TaxID=141349 RepID=UPI000B0F234D|nr:hypothetical protein [Mycobacterium lentiflavum]
MVAVHPHSEAGPFTHTKTTPTWETYRLVGTLDGHLRAYRHPQLPAVVTSATDGAGRPAGTSILA